jgi:hypothetical protein
VAWEVDAVLELVDNSEDEAVIPTLTKRSQVKNWSIEGLAKSESVSVNYFLDIVSSVVL